MRDAELYHDMAALRAQFPEWVIGTQWVTAGSGPDALYLTARRDGVPTLTAPDADGLRRKICEAGG